jgi:hypothetical protein
MKISFRFIRGEEARKQWHLKMKEGRNAYVWRNGILRWGIPVNIPTFVIFERTKGIPSAIVYFLAFTVVSGIAFGLCVWYANCWLYTVD